MIRKFVKRKIAVATVVAVAVVGFQPSQARSNPAVLAPAACATGVGCVLVGAAVIGGAVFWVWQNNQTGARHHLKIEDPEEEAKALGGGTIVDQVIAGTQKNAEQKCREKLGSRYKETRWANSNRWDCIGYQE